MSILSKITTQLQERIDASPEKVCDSKLASDSTSSLNLKLNGCFEYFMAFVASGVKSKKSPKEINKTLNVAMEKCVWLYNIACSACASISGCIKSRERQRKQQPYNLIGFLLMSLLVKKSSAVDSLVDDRTDLPFQANWILYCCPCADGFLVWCH